MAGEPGWSVTDHLLATMIDMQNVSNWLFVAANSGKNTRNPKPKPIPRFGEKLAAKEKEQEPAREISSAELTGFFGKSMAVVGG
jgi:hypothetical protein